MADVLTQSGGAPRVDPRVGLERLVSVVQELSLARSLDAVTAIVRRAARELSGADGATFVLRDADHCFYADEEAISPLWKGRRFPMDICASGWVMNNRRHLVIEDVFADPRIPADAYRRTFVKSMAMVPIRTAAPIGAIGIYWAHRRHTDDDEVRLLQALADSTSIALENVQLYTDLERRICERTAQLQAANRELEAFAYSVSHDLRAPVRAIEGFSRALVEDYAEVLDTRGRDYLARVRSGAERMDRMIDDMLALSGAGSGRAAPRVDTVDVSALAREVVAELEAAERTPRVDVVVQEGMQARADAGLVRVLLQNLLGNAFKFTRTTERATIEVGARTVDGERVFHVRDNGVGFDASRVDELFGAFRRLHDGSEFPGTGIGLATALRIARFHGGRIWAEATPGGGATFCWTFGPLDDATGRMPLRTSSEQRPSTAAAV
jgi:signal transduction histidine kinase